MKHLLIILSILLLSSPVIGHPTGEHTLYKWKTSSGFVWKGFGDNESHTVYKGEVENGKPNGVGIMTEQPYRSRYVGEFKDGEYHGQGKIKYHRHSIGSTQRFYEGEWKDGKFHGQGTFKTYGGNLYVGQWKNGSKHGKAKLYYTHASGKGPLVRHVLEGVWEDNKCMNGIAYDENGKIIYKIVDGFNTNRKPKGGMLQDPSLPFFQPLPQFGTSETKNK